jgi:hypothetical protein
MKTLVVSVLLAGCLSVATAETVVERVNLAFGMKEGDTVRLAGSHGTVKVTRAPGTELLVEAVKRVDGKDAEDARRLLSEIEVTENREPGRVILGIKGPETSAVSTVKWPWRDRSWGVDCHLKVPATCSVEISLTSGDIDAADLASSFLATCTSGDIRVGQVSGGPVEILTTSGDVDIAGVEGGVTIRTTSGDVAADGVSGPVSIRTVSGDVSAASLESEVDIECVSGDIAVDGVRARCPTVRVGSTSGDISVALSTGASAVVSITTESGDVSFGDLPLSSTDARETRWEGTVGDGCGSVEIRTVGGDVLLGL